MNAWRAYDADLPEFAVAIDVYDTEGDDSGASEPAPVRHVVVQEYRAPASVNAAVAAARLDAVVRALPALLETDRERVHVKVRERPERHEPVRAPGDGRRERGERRRRPRRAGLPLAAELLRLPRHRDLPRSPERAPSRRRTGARRALPEPVRLHGGGDGRGRRRRRARERVGGSLEPLLPLGGGEPRAERGGAGTPTASCAPTRFAGSRVTPGPSRATRRRSTSSSSIRRRSRTRPTPRTTGTCSAITSAPSRPVSRASRRAGSSCSPTTSAASASTRISPEGVLGDERLVVDEWSRHSIGRDFARSPRIHRVWFVERADEASAR